MSPPIVNRRPKELENDQPSVELVCPKMSNPGWMVFYFSMITFLFGMGVQGYDYAPEGTLIIALKNEGKRLSYG